MNHEYFSVVEEFQIQCTGACPVVNNADLLIQERNADFEEAFARESALARKS